MSISLDAFTETEQAIFRLEKLDTLLLALYFLHEQSYTGLSNRDYQNIFFLIQDMLQTESQLLNSILDEQNNSASQTFANSLDK